MALFGLGKKKKKRHQAVVVVDRKVVSYGKVLKKEEVIEILKKVRG